VGGRDPSGGRFEKNRAQATDRTFVWGAAKLRRAASKPVEAMRAATLMGDRCAAAARLIFRPFALANPCV